MVILSQLLEFRLHCAQDVAKTLRSLSRAPDLDSDTLLTSEALVRETSGCTVPVAYLWSP